MRVAGVIARLRVPERGVHQGEKALAGDGLGRQPGLDHEVVGDLDPLAGRGPKSHEPDLSALLDGDAPGRDRVLAMGRLLAEAPADEDDGWFRAGATTYVVHQGRTFTALDGDALAVAEVAALPTDAVRVDDEALTPLLHLAAEICEVYVDGAEGDGDAGETGEVAPRSFSIGNAELLTWLRGQPLLDLTGPEPEPMLLNEGDVPIVDAMSSAKQAPRARASRGFP